MTLEQAFVTIVRADDDAVGNGVLLDSGHVITCAHVWADAGEGAKVRFHYMTNRPACEAQAAPEGIFPISDDCQDGVSDIAFLTLREEPDFDLSAIGLRLARSAKPQETELVIAAYLMGVDSAKEIDAELGARSDTGQCWIKATDDFTQWVERGVSGAPVFVKHGEVVEGIVRARDKTSREALIIPAAAIAKALERVKAAAFRQTAHHETPCAAILELLAQFRDGARKLRTSYNSEAQRAERLESLARPIERIVSASAPDDAALARLAERLGRLEKEAAALLSDNRAAPFAATPLGALPALFEEFAIAVQAAKPEDGHAIENDWLDEAAPHAAQRDLLRAEIKRLTGQIEEGALSIDETLRGELLDALDTLDELLCRERLSLAELDRLRARFEALKQEALGNLIRECQLFLGLFAVRLPALSIFRDRLEDGSAGPEMVVMPLGEFWMGSPADEAGRYDDEGPRHLVEISARFALGRYAVTFAEFDAYCAAANVTPLKDSDWGRGRRPVINVSWEDAQAYLSWLGSEARADYRLPSESEWEYACRAGSETTFEPTVAARHKGKSIEPDEANFDGNDTYADGAKGSYRRKTLPVDTPEFSANRWHLSQMHGNVYEWCADEFENNYHQPRSQAPFNATKGGSQRVLRGGSWNGDPGLLRSALRGGFVPDLRSGTIGFRLARTLTP